MKTHIYAQQLNSEKSYPVDVVLTSTCPTCGVSIIPTILASSLVCDEETGELTKCFLLNHCSSCNECFISKHMRNKDSYIYEYLSAAPKAFLKQSFSDDIQNLSPDFVSIYNDSLHAECLGMLSICGMGYRKALEFLIKDFAISNNPNDIQTITNMPLAQCIDNYVSDNRLKSLAKASAWLGNDATHYIKKHPLYGTDELKAFINAFITFIDADFAYSKAQALLSST